MVKRNKNNSRNLLTIILVILAVVFVAYLFNSGNDDLRIIESEFFTMVEEGKVSDVVFTGNTAKIRVVGSEIEVINFPAKYDYHIDIQDTRPKDKVLEFNDSVTAAKSVAEEDRTEEQQILAGFELISHDTLIVRPSFLINFISSIVPFLSIAIMLFLGFFLFKMISGKGGGAPTFGKSKAKLSEKSNVRFNDIAGADEEKEETREIVEFLKNPGRFKQLGARIPKGVLLVGPPGTGKTLLAKAVAGESNVPFFSISGSDFVELYVGVGASRVRDLFENAKKMAPCIIFIDEIDAVGRQRGAGMGGGNDEREQTLNQLLVEMDGFSGSSGIIVMAATNRADILDPALLRPGRFDRQIYVHVPDVKGREGIIRIHAKNKPIDKEVDFKEIARLTSGATGADIENFLNEAAILAARDGRLTITMEDITEGINKALMGPQKKSRLVTEKDKKITAYHEAGHAIIAKVLDAGYNVHEVSIIPRGMAGGYTSFRPSDDDEFFTLTKANRRIAAIMGGRAAEEIIFKDITTGASSDIVSATKLARKMVTEWGMSSRLGFLNLGSGSELFLGRDYQTQTQYSEKTASIIDEEIKAILDDNYSQVIKILNDKIDILHNMASLLLERETIFSEEVDQIMEGVDYKEIIKEIEKKERARKRRENKKKKELEEIKLKQMQELKLKAAEALSSAGVLSVEDLDVIRNQTKEELSKEVKAEKPKTTPKKKTTTVIKSEKSKEKSKTKTAPKAKTTTSKKETPKKNSDNKKDDSKKDS